MAGEISILIVTLQGDFVIRNIIRAINDILLCKPRKRLPTKLWVFDVREAFKIGAQSEMAGPSKVLVAGSERPISGVWNDSGDSAPAAFRRPA